MLNYEQISKILSENQEFIKIINKDLLNVYENSYTLDLAQILANGVSVTYTPHLAVHSALPSIIIQCHPHVSQYIMINAIDQCFQVYLRSNSSQCYCLFLLTKPRNHFSTHLYKYRVNRICIICHIQYGCVNAY